MDPGLTGLELIVVVGRGFLTRLEPGEVNVLADELGPIYGPLVIVTAYTGLRPSEWAALEWRDIDRDAG